jgi:DDE superfamily endonuclease
MLPLVEIPEIVRHFAPFFASVFSPEALVPFQRYVSGLIVSENKTVDGINRLFVIDVRHQSSLNRLLTESPLAVEALNQARLHLLGSLAGTCMKPQGVLSLDDTLLTHDGQDFDKIAYLYDSIQGCYVWAHNLVNLHYSDDQTDYPVDFRLWEPVAVDALEAGLQTAGVAIRERNYVLKESDPKKWRNYLLHLWRRHQNKPAVQQLYQSKLLLAQQMLTKFFADHPERHLPVTFDNWYTQPAFCQFLDKTLQAAYIGTLADDDLIILASGVRRLDAFALKLKEEPHTALKHGTTPIFHKITIHYKGERKTYYSYCNTHRIHNFGKQRLVINHRKADLSDAAMFFMSNKLNWQAQGITRIRRHRWPVEVYHEEGKADGLDQYQVRNFHAIYRHIALVAVTYSLLRAAQHDHALLHTLQQQIKTTLDGSAGSCRRHTQAQALWALATFIAAALAQGQTLSELMQPLLAAVCYEGTASSLPKAADELDLRGCLKSLRCTSRLG